MRRRIRQFRDFRGVLQPAGAVVLGLGIAMLFCAIVGAIWDSFGEADLYPEGGLVELIMSAGVCAICGVPAFVVGKRHGRKSLSRREAVLSVVVIWFAAGLVGGLPFIFASGLSPVDAFFEAVSGLTTTGATVISDIESRLSRSLLLWRSLLQWLGGMGIVVLFVAIFPSMGVGGKHMFRGEVPGAQSEGLKPRIAETSFVLWKLYLAFTVLEAVLLVAFGMPVFKAVCHALTTMSTGGFSTEDSSVGGFNSAAFEYVIAIFMLIGTVNYGLYFASLKYGGLKPIWRSIEFRVYVYIVVAAVLTFTVANLDVHRVSSLTFLEVGEASFRNALFMTATTVSSTGYGAGDYTQWSQLSLSIMIALMFVGGCSGSTAGGIKIERIVLLFKQTIAQVKQSFQPSVVQVVRMGRSAVDKSIIADVSAFFFVYAACMMLGSGAIVLIEDNCPIPTAFGAMLTSLSNMGPGPFHNDYFTSDNFKGYSDTSKLIFVFAMILGRLEFFTLLSLFVPSFWRR